MNFRLILMLIFIFSNIICYAQKRWNITGKNQISWHVDSTNIPHQDNIEMAGQRVAGIISYKLDKASMLAIERQIFFPQLHPYIKDTDPAWFVYRAYVKDIFDDEVLPSLWLREKEFIPGPLKTVSLNGKLQFEHHPGKSGLQLSRSLYPSMSSRLFIENWTLKNLSDSILIIKSGKTTFRKIDYGDKGKFTQTIQSTVPETFNLSPGDSISFDIKFMAQLNEAPMPNQVDALRERNLFLQQMQGSLILETPDPVLNTLFEFSKLRASESIFDSELGLIHSPGGGRYYVGIWANDQAEYVSPLFPYLGYETGDTSAMNCYRAFANETNPQYKPIRYAFEIEGLVKPFLLDRGDAAMIAYGASHFLLANANEKEAKELWPLIEWCLEFCHRQLNESGVVESESDEMEGRIETGTANLSTSALYYGALTHSIDLAKALGKEVRLIDTYKERQITLASSIENYFGAKVEGLDTYKYYDTHDKLRHWICLPLVVGIHDRTEATVTALFDRLWTDNGVYVEKNAVDKANAEIFWDRGTLYALRGTFFAGATEVSLKRLQQYSKQRLLGKRVPYAVEAYPEGAMAHLSAESGLYCRVFTEGMFGIVPKGFQSFECTPRLPKAWDNMALRKIKAFGQTFDLEVKRKNKKKICVTVNDTKGIKLIEKVVKDGETVTVKFK